MADVHDPAHPRRARYRVRPVVTPAAPAGAASAAAARADGSPAPADAAYLRAQTEDDDGYDPYSDRPAPPEATFQEDPWR